VQSPIVEIELATLTMDIETDSTGKLLVETDSTGKLLVVFHATISEIKT